MNRRLNPGSQKDTRHFELDLTGWGLNYGAGDSMAIYPSNDPVLVDEILQALGASGEEIVPSTRKGKTVKLRDALFREYSITQATPKFLKAIAQRASGGSAPLLNELLHPERKADLENFSRARRSSISCAKARDGRIVVQRRCRGQGKRAEAHCIRPGKCRAISARACAFTNRPKDFASVPPPIVTGAVSFTRSEAAELATNSVALLFTVIPEVPVVALPSAPLAAAFRVPETYGRRTGVSVATAQRNDARSA